MVILLVGGMLGIRDRVQLVEFGCMPRDSLEDSAAGFESRLAGSNPRVTSWTCPPYSKSLNPIRTHQIEVTDEGGMSTLHLWLSKAVKHDRRLMMF